MRGEEGDCTDSSWDSCPTLPHMRSFASAVTCERSDRLCQTDGGFPSRPESGSTVLFLQSSFDRGDGCHVRSNPNGKEKTCELWCHRASRLGAYWCRTHLADTASVVLVGLLADYSTVHDQFSDNTAASIRLEHQNISSSRLMIPLPNNSKNIFLW